MKNIPTSTSSSNVQISGNLSIYGIKFLGCIGKIDGKNAFGALAENIPGLSTILTNLPGGVSLPAIPNIEIDKLWLNIIDGKISLATVVEAQWELPIAGKGNIKLNFSKITFNCSHDQHDTNGNSLDISIVAKGSFTIPDILSIPDFEFTFKYGSDGVWYMDSDLPNVTILGKKLSFRATYTDDKQKQELKLSIKSKVDLIKIPHVFTFTTNDLSFSILKYKNDQLNRNVQIDVSSSMILSLGNLKPQKGTLYFSESYLKYKSDSSVRIPLLKNKSGTLDVELELRIEELKLAWGKLKEFTADFDINIIKEGLPDWLKKVIPGSIETKFTITEKSVCFKATNTDKSIAFTLPDIHLSDEKDKATIPLSQLGEASFKLCSLGFELGESISIDIIIGIGLPKNLNNIFGTTEKGPNLILFNTKDLIEFEFSLSYSDTLSGSFEFITPPILPEWLKTVKHPDGSVDWDLTLGKDGKYGEISIGSPKFEIKPNGFIAKGELGVVKPLKIPLIPFKQFLGNTLHIPEVEKIIPDSWPIQAPSLLNDKGTLAIDSIIDFFLAHLANKPDLSKLKDVLTEIEKFLDGAIKRLPDRLIPYLEPQFEKGFKDFKVSFDIQIGEDGSISLDLESKIPIPGKTGEYKPIRFLWPMFGGVPTLTGCMFRKLSFGTMLGGSLFKLKVDCEFDTFDLPELLIGLLFPRGSKIPVSHDFHNHLIIQNLFIIIIYETEIPIPIPIFYDILGWEYLNVAGFQLEAHAKFPNPLEHFKLIPFIKLFQDIIEFFKKPDVRFQPTEEQSALFPMFQIGKCFAQLPDYIGKGAYVGSKEDPSWSIKPLDIAAKAMNSLKFFSMKEIINDIPLKDRKGSEIIGGDSNESAILEFAGFLLKGTGLTWLFTTPEEFTKSEYQELSLNSQQAKELLSILPNETTPNSDGAIIFIKTGIDIQYLLECGITFGFVSSGRKSMATGFTFQGNLLSLYQVDLGAQVIVNNGLYAQGNASLKMFGITIISDSFNLEINQEGFAFNAAMSAFTVPGFQPMFSGQVNLCIGKTVFSFNGNVKTNLLYLPVSTESLVANKDGWKLSCNILGISSYWDVMLGKDNIEFNVSIPGLKLQAGLSIIKGIPFVNASIKADLVALQFDANFDTGHPAGSFHIGFLEIKGSVISGNATFVGDEYSLKGSISFYFTSVELKGYYSPPIKLYLKGASSFGIPGFNLSLTFLVGSIGIGISGTVTVGFEMKTSGAMAYSTELGCPALYLEYSFIGVRYYLRIGFNGSIHWPKKTKDWPDLDTKLDIEKKNIELRGMDEMKKVDLLLPFLAYIKRISNVALRKSDMYNSEEEARKWNKLIEIHHLDVNMTPKDRLSDYKENVMYNAKIIAKKPEKESEPLIENELFKEFNKKMMQGIEKQQLPESKKKSIKEYLLNSNFDEVEIYTDPKPDKTGLISVWKSGQSNEEISCVFDYDKIENTWERCLNVILSKFP